MVRLTLLVICTTTALVSAEALAHTRLTSPTPRTDSDGLKTGPCGNVGRTGEPMVLDAGDTITVSWLETVDHPGYYRIALSTAGDSGFDDNVLADDITDIDCPSTPCDYSQEITIPDVDCTDCTLQLIQYMGTAAPYSPYFSCADLTIGSGGGSPDAGGGGGDDGGVDGGCQIGSHSGNAGLLTFLLIGLLLAGVPRRRK